MHRDSVHVPFQVCEDVILLPIFMKAFWANEPINTKLSLFDVWDTVMYVL